MGYLRDTCPAGYAWGLRRPSIRIPGWLVGMFVPSKDLLGKSLVLPTLAVCMSEVGQLSPLSTVPLNSRHTPIDDLVEAHGGLGRAHVWRLAITLAGDSTAVY
jgi:hypothetical protein